MCLGRPLVNSATAVVIVCISLFTFSQQSCEVSIVSPSQCDQIGRFWKSLGDKLFLKSSQILFFIFGLKWRASFFSKNKPGSVLCNFLKNLGYFFSTSGHTAPSLKYIFLILRSNLRFAQTLSCWTVTVWPDGHTIRLIFCHLKHENCSMAKNCQTKYKFLPNTK